ncbi:MAG: hypothetical protein KatS3mg118_2408 [Paracoccaceae bacterium]|nr:MAG: hypothetical protein KatS3mg118_2408 [Paracoccaceae bacterium]
MALTRFDLPDLGEGLTEAEVVAWHVSPGDRVVADQPLVSLETDKAVVEIPAPWAGTVVRLLARVGEVVAVGAPLVEIDTAARPDPGAIVGDLGAPDPRAAAGAAAQTAGAAPAPDAGAGAPGPSGAAPRAMPAARALARARGIDLSGVTGTGPGGVITRADVAAAAEGGGGKGWAPLSGARRSMARRMAAAAAVPRATLHDLADIGAWMAPGADVLVRLIRACVAGARAAPQLNAWYDPQAMAVMRHDRVDLGIAVDTGGALLVPVLRDAGGARRGGPARRGRPADRRGAGAGARTRGSGRSDPDPVELWPAGRAPCRAGGDAAHRRHPGRGARRARLAAGGRGDAAAAVAVLRPSRRDRGRGRPLSGRGDRRP